MVFEVKESNDVIRFTIGRSGNKMAANMAEICHLNDHNSSCMTARDLMLVSFFMVFEVKEFNDVIRFNIRISKNKMAANMAEIWYSNEYISSSMRPRDLMFVSTLWSLGSINAMMSSDLKLDDQKTRWQPVWRKYGALKWL